MEHAAQARLLTLGPFSSTYSCILIHHRRLDRRALHYPFYSSSSLSGPTMEQQPSRATASTSCYLVITPVEQQPCLDLPRDRLHLLA